MILYLYFYWIFVPAVYFSQVPTSGLPRLTHCIWLSVKLPATVLGFSPIAAPLPVSESSSKALKYNSGRLMCLWPFSDDGHSSPTSSWRGFKAPQAYRGQHYHVLPVCTHCSSNLLVGPAASGALSGWQHSSIFSQIFRNIICPIQELVMAKLSERWAHYSTIYLYLSVFVFLLVHVGWW